MKFFVYLLLSKKNGKFITYVGYTKNLNKRLSLHNSSKGAKFTKGRKWMVIYKKSYSTKSLAMKNEYELKKNRNQRLMLKQKYINKVK